MSTKTTQPSSPHEIHLGSSLFKRIGSTWESIQEVWKLIEVLEEDDPTIW